ncbi:MAG TPA: peptide ABC transporter substrate-binding protein [Vicinamibacterales bacterium]|nr:peptide ABC transporter substrate-binding protein [Vicinamibacterales bacterium]
MRKLCLFAAAVALTSSCTTRAEHSRYFGKTEAPEGQVLRYVSGSEPESLDPQVSSGQPEARLHLGLFDGLTEYHPETGQAIPALAERWEPNGDNSEFTFHLRDARWSNGDPITSHDFVYSLRRGLAPVFAARTAYLAYDIKGARAYNEGTGKAEDLGVTAVDDRTLTFTLAQPVPFFPGLVAHQFFRPVPRKAVEAYGQAWTQPQHIVTSGAFTLSVWKPYNRLVFVRSPSYWDAARVRLKQITFYPVEDGTTIMNLFKAGEIDALYNHVPPAAWIDRLRMTVDHMDKPEAAIDYYMFNTTKAPMTDIRVRKAFNMAIDKVGLAAYERTIKPLTAFSPEGIFPGYPQPVGDPYDAARAPALLAEAGYRDAAGKYDPSTFPIAEVELTYNTNERNRHIAEYVQAQWKQNLQLTVPLKNMEWKTFLDHRAKLEYKGVARAGWVGDYMDPYTFLDLFSTKAGDNGSGWSPPEFVAAVRAANREPDPAQRYKLLAKAEKILLDAQPVIPLATSSTNWMKKPYVKGMYPNPVTLHPWKFVYIEHDPAKW